MNSRNLTFHQEYSIIFSGGVFGNHVLGFQTYFEFANCQEYPGIVVRCKAICFWARNCQKKFQRLGIPFNHIRSSWFAFVQRIIPMFSTNKHIFSKKSRLCVRSDTSAFSVLVIVSPYFQITIVPLIVPRNFFKKKVLWMSLQEQKIENEK